MQAVMGQSRSESLVDELHGLRGLGFFVLGAKQVPEPIEGALWP